MTTKTSSRTDGARPGEPFARLIQEFGNLGWRRIHPGLHDRHFTNPIGRFQARVLGDWPRLDLTVRDTGDPVWGIAWSGRVPVAVQLIVLHAALHADITGDTAALLGAIGDALSADLGAGASPQRAG